MKVQYVSYNSISYNSLSIYISMYKWINRNQSAWQQGAIYKLDWEGI